MSSFWKRVRFVILAAPLVVSVAAGPAMAQSMPARSTVMPLVRMNIPMMPTPSIINQAIPRQANFISPFFATPNPFVPPNGQMSISPAASSPFLNPYAAFNPLALNPYIGGYMTASPYGGYSSSAIGGSYANTYGAMARAPPGLMEAAITIRAPPTARCSKTFRRQLC